MKLRTFYSVRHLERLHTSVFLEESLEYLQVKPDGRYLDLTFGEGGHSQAILTLGAKLVVGVDRDAEALERYRAEHRDTRLELRKGRFSEVAPELGGGWDGILADLGVSTRQLLEAGRGFSFAADGPLDMRMDRTSDQTLENFLASIDSKSLADQLEEAVDLPRASKWAGRVLDAFHRGHLKTTLDLARLFGPKTSKHHPATVFFLGFRMVLNREVEEIRSLESIFRLLKPGGRMVVITFHSTEDRLVKRIFQKLSGKCICELPICVCERLIEGRLVTKKAVIPSREEQRRNPRSRSAKLRAIERI